MGYPTTVSDEVLPFKTRKAQEHVVRLLDLANNISYRLHTTRSWSASALDRLEQDMQKMLDQWYSLNGLAHELGAGRSKPTPIITWAGQEKVAGLHTIRRCCETLGAPRFLSSAIGEKAHQGPKHCLEMSKGPNKEWNSLKQAQRMEYGDVRKVYYDIQADEAEEEARQDMDDAPRNGVVVRGKRDIKEALPDLKDDLAARICHLVREVVRHEGDTSGDDLHELEELIPCCAATASGYRDSHRHLMAASEYITYRPKATIYRAGKKMFSVTPRGRLCSGSGVRAHVSSSGNAFTNSELVALLVYKAPSSKRSYCIAIIHLLQKVPGKLCVVRLRGGGAGPCCKDGDQVKLVGGSTLAGEAHSVTVQKCGNPLSFQIMSDLLAPITGRQPGVHEYMPYSGDYMQYGHNKSLDCSATDYKVLNEYEAISPSSGIKAQVCLVPDVGGTDTLGRPRFFWNKNLYSH